MTHDQLTEPDLLQLKRMNTPTIYNGWEQITRRDIARECFNLEEVRDFMPQMGPMIGYAATVVIEPGQPAHKKEHPAAWPDYRKYVGSLPGPKIVVIQDLDKPFILGSFWGEVNANIHRALGCVGTITDGGIRDLNEMTSVGFKALARRLCVGHAHVVPVRWDCEVQVFGCKVEPGQLIHADKHGFLAIPKEDEEALLAAALFMDQNECSTVIPAARNTQGMLVEDILARIEGAGDDFRNAVQEYFGKVGEW